MSQADETAPDGANENTNSEDLIPRSQAQEAFRARDEAKQRARELEAKVAELEARTSEKPKPKPASKSQANVDEMPAWAKQIQEQNEKLAALLEGKEQGERRAKIVETVLAKVPDGNRALAGAVLDGLVARGKLSLEGSDTGAIADAAAQALKTSHGELFRLPGSSASAIQVGPDGKIDWSTVKSAADVPDDAWGSMPDEVLDRISGGAGSAKSGGLLLGGG